MTDQQQTGPITEELHPGQVAAPQSPSPSVWRIAWGVCLGIWLSALVPTILWTVAFGGMATLLTMCGREKYSQSNPYRYEPPRHDKPWTPAPLN